MFNKILIANRGEITVRIIQTCKRLGIGTVAVYSTPDFRSLHVLCADEAVELGGARPSESYLSKEKIIQTALQSGCQAIHPGYGFLSENAAFAEMVTQAGLTFIGPPAGVIATLGDKIAAKQLAAAAGVPTVPGHMQAVTSNEEAAVVAREIGYPVLLKPAAGGGGKGMRIVDGPEQLAAALKACRQETLKAFGDDSIFIERFIRSPRHVEIQIMADQHGNVVHLGERECSIQRRYQKIIEESPSPVVDKTLRARMGALACELSRKAGYVNAGTVEFILAPDKQFYFLEMNTRLQVEHPVTEKVTGLDLVEMQLRIADGEVLPLSQKQIRQSGWAIEARICAEDTEKNFVPSVGLITRYAEPRGSHVRVDSGVDAGSTVHLFYDSMLAKVITWGEDREQARQAMVHALNGYHIEGVHTNVDFANRVITHPAFVAGELSTDFIADHLQAQEPVVPADVNLDHMAIASTLIYHLREDLVQHSLIPLKARVGGVTLSRERDHYISKSNGDIFEVEIQKQAGEHDWRIKVNATIYQVTTPPMEYYRRRLKLIIDGRAHYFRHHYSGNFIETAFCGLIRQFEIYNPREWRLAAFMPPPAPKAQENVLKCPMPGLVVELKAKAGDRVYKGQELVTLESMKMESSVSSPVDAQIASVEIQAGDTVDTDTILMVFEV